MIYKAICFYDKWPYFFSAILIAFFSFPCSSVGMHTIWVPTLEHGNQVGTQH